jgi:transcription initiation factor IIE alpha subunit
MQVGVAAGFLKLNFGEQVRYLFECPKCGNALLFGMVYDWENETQNMQISYLDDKDK